MQLFVTNPDPILAARDLDDARVVKIALEVAQILCTSLHHQGKSAPYKPSHAHHPITKWVIASPTNALWAHRHGLELCRIYTGWRHRQHACEAVLHEISSSFDFDFADCAPASFQNSARGHGLDFTHLPVLEAYRTYLTARWLTGKKAPRWAGRNHPRWFKCWSEN